MLKEIIHFYKSTNLDKVKSFYSDVLGLDLYKDQGTCLIFTLHKASHIGFCLHFPKEIPSSTCITLVYETVEDVDDMYEQLSKRMQLSQAPSYNHTYHIYHFFCQDYEGHTVEVQTFMEDKS